MNRSPIVLPLRLLPACLLAAALTFGAVNAHAMTVLYGELPDLVRASELVLHGKISDVQVVDRRKEGRGVWTEFTLAVLDVWKGDRKTVGTVFRWRHIGGSTADGMTLHVPGMPTFVAGEETVVLLERHSEGHVLTGATQGKFFVTADKKGAKFASRSFGGVNLVSRGANGRLSSVRSGGAEGDHSHLLPPPEAPQPIAALRDAIVAWVKADSQKAMKPAPIQARGNRAIPVKTAGKVKP
mgnify:CR=1 FL=1